ncbi:hypothetical protein ILYODFUR_021723, partial [Ilyodon furcidens]
LIKGLKPSFKNQNLHTNLNFMSFSVKYSQCADLLMAKIFERGRIVVLHKQAIPAAVGCSKAVIQNFLRGLWNKKSSGRPKIISQALCRITGADCSPITIRRHLKGKGGGCHHDLGCFFLQWDMELQIVQGHQTAAGYVEMLQQASITTEGPRLCSIDWVFQQNNAAVCNACKGFQENSVTLLDHPGCSPDVNPIRNTWRWMAREVYKKYTSVPGS